MTRALAALAMAALAACAPGTPSSPAARIAALGELETCPLDDVDRGDLPPLPPPLTLPARTPPAPCVDGHCVWDASDDIYGATIPRAGSWFVADGWLYHGDHRVALHGVSWFGFESKDVALHGLWTGRTVADFLDQMVSLGIDAIRLPLAPEAWRPGHALPSWAADTAEVKTSAELLEQLLAGAERRDMVVLLDVHTCAAGLTPPPGTPGGCAGASVDSWLGDLRALATLAGDHPNIIGIDLYNEPYDLLWGEWADLAARGARAVLGVNPRILVFVQGASYRSAGAAYDTIAGESLVHSEVYPPDIPPSRLVYAPHAYGPDVFDLNYLDSEQYPAVLPNVWELRFGHAFTQGHGFVIGEFGGHYDDTKVPGSVDWQDRFVAWLRARGIDSFFYWCWNPNSGNTGGILEDDWETPDPRKLALLRPLLAPRTR